MTRSQIAGFLTLCLLYSSTWLTGDFLPPALEPITGQGFRLLLIGLACLALFLISRRLFPNTHHWQIAVAGTGLLAAPFLLLNAARGITSSALGVIVFSLVPVAALLMTGGTRLLTPALVGVTGLLFLLPITLPATPTSYLGLAAMAAAAILTAASIVWLSHLLPTATLAPSIALTTLTSGALLLAIGAATEHTSWHWSAAGVEALRCLLLDLPQVLLLLWLVRNMAPHRVAARYLVAPLFTVLEGLYFIGQGFNTRMAVGLAALAAGAIWLLRAQAADPNLSLTQQQ